MLTLTPLLKALPAILAISLPCTASIQEAVPENEGCSGCDLDHYTWGQGAATEIWIYTPPASGDEAGNCLANCEYNQNCEYSGCIRFRNSGKDARDIYDGDGNHVATVSAKDKSKHIRVNISAPCGASGDAAKDYKAYPAGQGTSGKLTSAYLFRCTVCN